MDFARWPHMPERAGMASRCHRAPVGSCRAQQSPGSLQPCCSPRRAQENGAGVGGLPRHAARWCRSHTLPAHDEVKGWAEALHGFLQLLCEYAPDNCSRLRTKFVAAADSRTLWNTYSAKGHPEQLPSADVTAHQPEPSLPFRGERKSNATFQARLRLDTCRPHRAATTRSDTIHQFGGFS